MLHACLPGAVARRCPGLGMAAVEAPVAQFFQGPAGWPWGNIESTLRMDISYDHIIWTLVLFARLRDAMVPMQMLISCSIPAIREASCKHNRGTLTMQVRRFYNCMCELACVRMCVLTWLPARRPLRLSIRPLVSCNSSISCSCILHPHAPHETSGPCAPCPHHRPLRLCLPLRWQRPQPL